MKFITLIISGLLVSGQLAAVEKAAIPNPLNSIPTALPADIVVKGKVSDKQGALPGVSVKVKGTTKATVTDANGNFSISAPENGTLVFYSIGYVLKEVPLNNRTTINVILDPDQKELDEVIVTGYRAQTRGSITGSVTSVNSAALKDTPVDNLSNALSGRLSGVTITQAAGTPGMESAIRIRSQGTFNNQEPLYVIDGIVSDKFTFDGLGPTEVESVTILKDGASAAIYGSRAANGVVLVTTKRGREGEPKLTYSGLVGLQSPTKIAETFSAFEHVTEINRQLAYTKVKSDDPRYYTPDELDYFKTHSWNWVDEMWKDPISTQHSIDISGGTPAVKYFLGGSYNYATGTFNNVGFKKFNLRGNVDVSVTKNLKVSLDLNTNKRNTNGPSWDINNWRLEDLYKALLVRPKMVPPYVNGLPVGNWVEWHPGVVLQPEVGGYNNREWSLLNSTITANYKVPGIDGLSAKVSYNRYSRDVYVKQFNLPYDMTVFNTIGTNKHIVGDQPIGIRPRVTPEFLQERSDKDTRYQFNAQLNYNKTFGKHSLDALLVYEQAEEDDKWFSGRKDDFISTRIDQMIAGSKINSTVDGKEEELARLSYVGLVGYNYAQKYLLEASFRYDGSVIFAPENRWGFFPSVSAGWRISEEPFFKGKVGFVNDLKLRASVGMLGNDAVGNFQWLQAYNIVPGAIFDGPSFGLEQAVLLNRAITWEKSVSYNGGLDAQLMDSKISLKLDAFYRHTYDILGSREFSLPSTLGAELPDENYQEINSKGFEIELGYNNQFGSKSNPFTYFIRGNFGLSANEVVKTDEPENIRPYLSALGRPTNGVLGYVATDILRTQADLDALPAGYTIIGIAPQLGMLNYKDIRGPSSDTPDGKITIEDQEYISDYRIPPMNFGLSFGASWGALSVDALLQGVAGGHVMMPTAGRDVQARAEESSMAYWADSWSPDNPDGKYPGYRNTAYRTRYDESTFWLQDLSFLRFKNLNISYSMPKNLISSIGVKSARVFVTGTNLFMLYSGNKIYDPEMNNILSYPMMRTYSLGLNIGL